MLHPLAGAFTQNPTFTDHVLSIRMVQRVSRDGESDWDFDVKPARVLYSGPNFKVSPMASAFNQNSTLTDYGLSVRIIRGQS